MARLLAAAFFVCAAFAWVPPFLDRPGVAALGFGFLALSVGRKAAPLRQRLERVAPPAALDHPERIEPLSAELADYLAKL